MAQRNISLAKTLPPQLSRGTVAFVPALPNAVHANFVTHAFSDDPIKEVLLRLPEYAHKRGAVKSNYKPPLLQQELQVMQETPTAQTP